MWIESYPQDFDEDKKLEEEAMKFLEASSRTYQISSREIMRLLVEKPRMNRDQVEYMIFLQNAPKPFIGSGSRIRGAKRSILVYHPVEVARQWTLLSHDLFKRIRPKEYMDQAWNKKGKDENAPNIVDVIDNFNQVTLCSHSRNVAHSHNTLRMM